MKTVEEIFLDYFKHCYKNAVPPQQYGEIKQAFYSGALGVLSALISFSADRPDDESDVYLRKLVDELQDYGKARAAELEKFS